MTVLVTGGAGYIGSHMVHALVDAGERVVVLDNLASGFDWAVAQGASLVIGDVGDQPRVAALMAEHQVDALLAWAPRVQLRDGLMKTIEYFERLLRSDPRDERLPIRSAKAAG
jgi:UDP-glucose 4-epimerase